MNAALEVGYRHFDTSTNYNNEDIIGDVIKAWLESGRITRQELFITTKVSVVWIELIRIKSLIQK